MAFTRPSMTAAARATSLAAAVVLAAAVGGAPGPLPPAAAQGGPTVTLVGRWPLAMGATASMQGLCPIYAPFGGLVGAGFDATSDLYAVVRCGPRVHLARVTAGGVVTGLGMLPDQPRAATVDPVTHRLIVADETSGGRYGVKALPLPGGTMPERTWNAAGNATDPDTLPGALAAGAQGAVVAFSRSGVARYGPGAERTSTWPVRGADGTAVLPGFVAVDRAGAIYLTGFGLPGVARFDALGRRDAGFAVAGAAPGAPVAGYALDDQRAVLEPAAGGGLAARFFAPDGQTLAVRPVDRRLTDAGRAFLAVGPGGDYAVLQPVGTGAPALQLALHAADGTLRAFVDGAPPARPFRLAPRVATRGGQVAAMAQPGLVARFAPDGTARPAVSAPGGLDDLDLLDGGDVVARSPVSATALTSRVQRLADDGTVRWSTELPGGSGAISAHGERIFALSADDAVVTVLDAADGRALGRIDVSGGDGLLPTDVSAGPRGVSVIDAAGDRLEVWDEAVPFRPAQRVDLTLASIDARIAAGPAGLTAVLAAWDDGGGAVANTVRIVDAAGAVVWDLARDGGIVDAQSWPADVAFGADGRLAVLLASPTSHGPASVAVFDVAVDPSSPPPTPAPPPPPPPANDGPCRVDGDKTAAPPEIWLGETVTVTLTLQRACPDVETVADIVLVVDVSGSMAGGKERGAANAVRAFVDDIDLARHRIGLVTFSQVVRLVHPLSDDPAVVRDVPNSYGASGGTDIAAALVEADAHLAQRARAEARQVILLVTDGVSAQEPALAAAAAARRRGVRIFTVGVAGADNALLRRIAGRPEQHFSRLRPEDLPALYRQLATLIASGAGAAVLDDVLGPDVDLVPATFNRAPEIAFGAGLRWGFGAQFAAPITLTYQVRPRRTGIVPTNTSAWFDFVDGDGVVRRFTYPVPEVLVRAPTPTPLPPTPTPTPTPTPEPRPIYLPIALREAACLPSARHVDVALVVDASTSMRDAAPSGRPKIEVALDGVRGFLAALDLPGDGAGPPEAGDRAAIVAFHAGATLLQPLTADRAALERALAAVAVAPQTCIACGLEAAVAALAGARRGPAHTPAIVLLTDGRSNPRPIGDAEVVAADAQARGIAVFTIALGDDVEAEALARMASRPAYAYRAPTADDLAAIYAAVAGAIPCPAAAHWGGR